MCPADYSAETQSQQCCPGSEQSSLAGAGELPWLLLGHFAFVVSQNSTSLSQWNTDWVDLFIPVSFSGATQLTCVTWEHELTLQSPSLTVLSWNSTLKCDPLCFYVTAQKWLPASAFRQHFRWQLTEFCCIAASVTRMKCTNWIRVYKKKRRELLPALHCFSKTRE